VEIWQSYGKNIFAQFFWDTVYTSAICIVYLSVCVGQECYSTVLKTTDGKKQKVILRILKRIVSVSD